MRVRPRTIDVSTEERRAIRHHHGEPGLATRKDVRDFIDACYRATMDDLVYESSRDEGESI
jgi:hypothetical protein